MQDLLTAFGVVFVAELGDKTQLAAAGFATRHQARLVAIGVVLGCTVVSSFSVLIGTVTGATFPTRAVNIAAALVFITVGVATLCGGDPDDGEPKQSAVSPAALAVIGSIALAMALAELGDKTMLATISLAADSETVATWIGATTGITSAGLLGVVFGDTIARRVSPQVIRLSAAAIFLSIGTLMLTVALR